MLDLWNGLKHVLKAVFLEKLIKYEQNSSAAIRKSVVASANLLPTPQPFLVYKYIQKLLWVSGSSGMGFGESMINISTLIFFWALI